MKFADSPVLAPTFPPWRSRLVLALLGLAFGGLVRAVGLLVVGIGLASAGPGYGGSP